MATPRPVTDQERAEIRRLHAEGKGRNDIARALKRSGRTISEEAKALGLSFERGPEVAAATAAVQADNRARRATLISRAYGRAEKIYDRLEADETSGYKFTATTVKGIETELLDHVPGQEEKALAAAASQHLTVASKLEAVDGDSGVEAARSMLGALAAGLTRLANAPGEDDNEEG